MHNAVYYPHKWFRWLDLSYSAALSLAPKQSHQPAARRIEDDQIPLRRYEFPALQHLVL
jgi:hypothetical protein